MLVKELEQSFAICISTKTIFSEMTEDGCDKIVCGKRFSESLFDTYSRRADSSGSRLRIWEVVMSQIDKQKQKSIEMNEEFPSLYSS